MRKLYGIGTGPGDPDLLTIKAVKTIEISDVIFAPNNKGRNMALETARQYIKGKEVVYLDFPMGRVTLEDYQNAAKTIMDKIPEDGVGTFLTIGDSMVYSTFIYILRELEKEEIEIEIVPGIPSFIASAAEAKIPLTEKGENFILCDEFHEDLLKHGESIAILKTLREKESIINSLEKGGYSYNYIKNATLYDQAILKDREEIINDRHYMSLILARKN